MTIHQFQKLMQYERYSLGECDAVEKHNVVEVVYLDRVTGEINEALIDRDGNVERVTV